MYVLMRHEPASGCHGTAPHNSSTGSSGTKLDAAHWKNATQGYGRWRVVDQVLLETTKAANTTGILYFHVLIYVSFFIVCTQLCVLSTLSNASSNS